MEKQFVPRTIVTVFSPLLVGFFLFFGSSGVARADIATGGYPTADGTTESANWKTGSTACNTTNCYDEMDNSTATSINNTASGDESFVISPTPSISLGATISSVDVSWREQYTQSCTGGVDVVPVITPFVRLNGTTNYSGTGVEMTLSDSGWGSHTQTITVNAAYSSGNIEIGFTYQDGSCLIASHENSTFAFGPRKAHAVGADVKGFIAEGYAGNISYTVPSTPITISGTVYSDKGVTATSSTVKVVVNGTTASSTSAAANGTYSVTMIGPAGGIPITVYLDNGSSTKAGATVTRYSGSGNISGLNVYNKTLIARHEDSGPVTNSNIGVCDKTTGSSCSDSDLHYDESGGALTVDNDWDLFVWTGKTFTPGGDVTLSTGGSAANVYVSSSGAMSMGANNFSIPTAAKFNLLGVFSQTTGTTTIQSGGTLASTNGNFLTFGNLIASSGVTAVNASTTIAGILTVKSGVTLQLAQSGGTLPRVTFSGTGNPINNSGTITFNGNNTEVAYTGSSATISNAPGTYTTLILGSSTASGTYTPQGDLTGNSFIIATSTGANTYNASNATTTWGVFTLGTNGVFTPQTSTIIHTQGGGTSTVPGLTFYNLKIGNAGTATVYNLGGNITVQNILSTGGTATTLNCSSYTVTLSGGGTPFVPSGTLTFNANTSTFNYTGTSTTNIALVTYNNLGVGTTADSNAVTYTLLGTTTVSGQVTLGNAASGAVDTFSPGAYTLYTGTNALPVNVPGNATFDTAQGTVVYTGTLSALAVSASTTYYNLVLSPSSTAAQTTNYYFTHAANRTLTVNGNFTISYASSSNSGGTVTFTGSNYSGTNIVTKGNVTVSACPGGVTCNFIKPNATWTMSPSGTKTFTNNFSSSLNIGSVALSGGASTPQISLAGSFNFNFTTTTIASGHTLALSGSTALALTGSLTGDGTLSTASGNTITLTGPGYLGGSSAGWTVGGLTIGSGTVTATGTNAITVSSVLTISGGTTLNAGIKTWTLSGTGGTPFSNSGTFTASSSTFIYTGNYASGNTTIAGGSGTNYYNLTLNNSGETYTYSGDLTINNDWLVATGTSYLAGTSRTFIIGGNYTNYGNRGDGGGGEVFKFTATTPNHTIRFGTSTGGGSVGIDGLVFDGVGGSWSILDSKTGFSDPTSVYGGIVMTNGTLNDTNGSADIYTFGPVKCGATCGTIDLSRNAGQTLSIVTGGFTFGPSAGGTWHFNNLSFIEDGSQGGSDITATTSGAIYIHQTLTVDGQGQGLVFIAGTSTSWYFDKNSGTPLVFTNGGSLTARTSSFYYQGTGGVTIAGATYYNLYLSTNTFGPQPLTLGGNTTINNALHIVESQADPTPFAASSYTLTFASSGTPFDWGFGTFDPGTGKVVYTGSATTTIAGVSYYDLEAKPGGASSHYIEGGTLSIGRDFTVGDGTHTGKVDASPYVPTLSIGRNMLIATSSTFKAANLAGALSIAGNYTNYGTFTANSGGVTFTGSGSQALSGTMTGGSAFYDLTLNGSGTSTTAGAIAVTNNFAHTNGTFDLGAGNNALTITGNYTRTGGAGFNMRGSTITVSGNWDSSGVANDYDTASSTIGTSTVVMNGNGTTTVATGSGSTWRTRFYNLNVAQGSGKTTQVQQGFGIKNTLTIGAGTLDLNTKEIALGNYAATSGANPLSIDPSATVGRNSGTFNFAGWGITQYIPGFNYGVGIKADGSALSVVQTGSVTTTQYLYVGNQCIGRSVTWDTAGYSLGVGSDLRIYESSSTLTLRGSTVTVGTNWTNGMCVTSGGTVSAGTSTVVFNATATGKTIKPSGQSFNNVTFNGSGGGWVFSSTTSVGGNFTMTAGTLSGTSTITVTGANVTGDGTINLTGGTFNANGTGNFGGNTAWAFGNLSFGGTATAVGSGGVTATGTLTVAGGGVLNAGGKTWTLLSGGTPLVLTGTFTPNTSTVAYAGTSATTIAASPTYYNLQVGSTTATTVYTLGGNTIINGALTINNSSGINGLAIGSYALTFASSGTVFVINENGASSTAFQAGTGTVNFTGAATTTIPALTYFNLGVKPSSTPSHQFAAGTIAIGGDFTVGDGTHTGMADASPNSTTLSVTGNMLVATSGVFKANAVNTLSVGGNYTNYGTLVHNTGQVTFNGTSQQTLTGNLSGGSAFGRLVFANNSGTLISPAILLTTSTQTAATSTIVTASTTVRFAAGQTYTLNSLNWNGGATSSLVGLRSSSGGTAWLLNVSGAKNVQYADVKDSNACGSSAHISVGNDVVDSTGNSCWDWPLPGTPGTPSFPVVSSTWAVVNWTSATNASYYNLYRSLNSGGPYAFIASTTLTSSTDNGLSQNTTYWYEVVGANGTGVGPTSTAASVTTLAVSQGYATSASLTSVIYDTSALGGVAPNSITWKGTRPANTTVKFQIAGANATTGPWIYTAWNGSGSNDPAVACDSVSYYPLTGTSEPNTPVEIKASCQQNKRYLRYKLFMLTNSTSATPTVDDIILNYAR